MSRTPGYGVVDRPPPVSGAVPSGAQPLLRLLSMARSTAINAVRVPQFASVLPSSLPLFRAAALVSPYTLPERGVVQMPGPCRRWSPWPSGRCCRSGFDMVQSQPLRSSLKLIISFTFSAFMLKVIEV